MKTKCKKLPTGFTLPELMVVIMVVAIAATLILVQKNRRRTGCGGLNCVNNLKQVGLGIRQWGMDNGDKYPAMVSITNGGAMEWLEAGTVWPAFSVVSNKINTPKVLFCPQDKSRKRVMATTFSLTPNPNWPSSVLFTNDNNTSYFIGMEADETCPQRILAGDSNLEVNQKPVAHGMLNLWSNAPVRWDKSRHEKQWHNIALADGSVQGFSSASLAKLLAETELQTNRLVIP